MNLQQQGNIWLKGCYFYFYASMWCRDGPLHWKCHLSVSWLWITDMYEFSHKRNLFPVPIIVTTKSLNRLVHIFSFSIVSFIWVNGHSSHLGSHILRISSRSNVNDWPFHFDSDCESGFNGWSDSNIKDENLRESSRIPCHPLIILKFVTPERWRGEDI